MTSSTSCSNSLLALVFVGLVIVSGCSHAVVARTAGEGHRYAKVAVLPIDNLSATPAPLGEIRQELLARLKSHGVDLLDEGVLEKFMAEHRLRNTSGIDVATSRALKEETGSEAVVITSLELYSPIAPPKVAFMSRLVRTGENPVIIWIDSFGRAGDDSPGFLELGLIHDPQVLTDKLLDSLANSVSAYSGGNTPAFAPLDGERRFRPKFYYRSPVLTPGQKYTVAVVPFFNKGERPNAGDILMLEFVRYLSRVEGMTVLEPGIVRDDLLRLRVTMDEGLTLDTADVVLATLQADLLVMGSVLDYQDYQGVFGEPKVDFTAELIDKRSLQIVWKSKSYNTGADGVFFFDRGRVNTANQLSSQMVENIVRMMETP